MGKEADLVKNTIKWPEHGVVTVGSHVDFAYIIRKDTDFTTAPIAYNLERANAIDSEDATRILRDEYEIFTAHLIDTIQWGFSEKGTVETHLYDPKALEIATKQKAGTHPIISLDPLLDQDVYNFTVSRGYYLGGKQDISQIPRPGTFPLADQSAQIERHLQGKGTNVAEDDMFSGGSVLAALDALIKSGIRVNKLIPGIQIGRPTKLTEMQIDVDPIVLYQAGEGENLFDKVDLGDPRDYLVGGSGLVVRLPDGSHGRAPYILPFVSPNARASIPQEKEKDFSLQVLKANFGFFHSLEEKLGHPVTVGDMHKDFLHMMHTLYGFSKDAPMTQVISWALDNMDDIWGKTQEHGRLQEALEKLQLPQNIVFIDVNGTLIPEEAQDGYIPSEDKFQLAQAVDRLKRKGVAVGLCSDSPLEQLQAFGAELGLDGPIISENGNIIAYNDQKVILQQLEGIDQIKEVVKNKADEQGILQEDDIVAPEFGGRPINSVQTTWGFGANRETSVSVFGSNPFIEALGAEFEEDTNGNVDCSPEYNYFAIHPSTNFRRNKGTTLELLAQHGRNIVMIGNSMSDWVDPKSGVVCSFVAESKIPEGLPAYISPKPLAEGVCEILNQITTK